MGIRGDKGYLYLPAPAPSFNLYLPGPVLNLNQFVFVCSLFYCYSLL